MSDARGVLDGSHAPEASLRALVGQMCDWYWETDAQARLTLLNSAGGATGPAWPADWQGRHEWDIPGELLQPSSWEEHRSCLQQRRPFAALVVRRVRSDGSICVARMSGAPAYDAAGAFVGYVGTGRDVSACLLYTSPSPRD